jgi:signal transduction histidine kinase
MRILNNLRLRLLLLVLLAVIPAIGVTVYSGFTQRRQVRESALAEAFHTIRAVVKHNTALVESNRQMLYSLAFTRGIKEDVRCQEYLNELAATGIFNSVYIAAHADGQVYCSTSGIDISFDLSEQSYFQAALANGEFIIGEPFVNESAGNVLLPVAVSVPPGQPGADTVLISLFDLELVVDPEITDTLPPQSALLIVDNDGQVLLRYPQVEESRMWMGQTLAHTPIIRTMLMEFRESSTEAEGIDGVIRLYAFTPLVIGNIQNMHISVGIPSHIAFASANQVMTQSLLLIGIASLLAFVAAWYGGDIFFLRIVSLTAERDEAESKLRDANQELEDRVAERTAELADVNVLLQAELLERKRALNMLRVREVELQRLLRRLERSNRDLQDFAYITSHDLQEPLRKIQAFGDRLSHRYNGQLGEEGVMFVNRMTTSAKRMQNMINDLLQYSRVSTRGGQFASVPLNEVISDVLLDLELRIHETGGTIELEDLPVIEADEGQMRQLFMNLIGNSLKFHRPGVPPVIKISGKMVRSDNEDQERQEQVVVCVEDNGIGFEEKYLDRIFQPFQRLYSKDTYEGSGIGLAICRKIADRHGGEITAQSTPGMGSRFIITLPLIQKKEMNEQI